MPEYLSPGVFVEEVPGKLKALEGVSTSTAAFAGPAERGPVAGFALPFVPDSGFSLTPDLSPVFLTSFAEFTRQFGAPLPIVTSAADPDSGYLGYSVKAFFDNGGKRCYIARVVDTAVATAGALTIGQGPTYQLVRSAKSGDFDIYVRSQRGLNVGNAFTIKRRSDNTDIQINSVASYSTEAGTVTLVTALPQDLDPSQVYAVGSVAFAATGPKFIARSPGKWSANISVQIVPSDRTAVRITAPGLAAATSVEVANASTFYVGAIVEIDHGSVRSTHEVTRIDGKTLTLDSALGTNVATTNFARVLEIDVAIADESGAAPPEIYRGLSWSQGTKADIRRHYAEVINHKSRLVFVQAPGVALLAGAENGIDVSEQPSTTSGFPEKLTPGVDGLPSQLPAGDGAYIGIDGGPGARTGIESFKDLTDVSLIAAPGRTSNAVQLALIAQCEILRYRFALLDAPLDTLEPMAVLAHRNLYDTSFAAYYAPWLGATIDGRTRWLPSYRAV